MKIICDICKQEFEYPLLQMQHRHKDYELDGVPPNFWSVKDYLPEFRIKVSKDGQIISPKVGRITKLKAGNTPLIRYSNNLYIKDESVNPTGSFKDRGMDMLMQEVIFHKKDKISVVSCGSGAISVIAYAKVYGLNSLVFIHEGISEDSLRHIKEADEVIYSKNFIKSYEDFFSYSYDHEEVFCGFLNTNISYMLGLRSLTYEIIRDLQKTPDVIVIPCGSGANIIAQHMALKELYETGTISKMPKIAVVEIEGGNPICEGYKKRTEGYLYIIDEPTSSKTILSNDTCFNYKKIFDMAIRNEAFFISVTDEEIDEFLCFNPNFAHKYDYTSVSAMAASKKYLECNLESTVVAILTCKNRMEEMEHGK